MFEDTALGLCQRALHQPPARSGGCWLRSFCSGGLCIRSATTKRCGEKDWEHQLVPAHLLLAKSPLNTEFGSESSEEALTTKGSKEDVRASSYYSLQLRLCLKLRIKTSPRDLRRITDKFSLCFALIFLDKCFFLYQAYGALDFKSH